MAVSSGASISSKSGGLRYALSTLAMYLHDFKDYLDTEWFDVMPSNGDMETIYDTRNGFDFDKALGEWARWGAAWGGCGGVL